MFVCSDSSQTISVPACHSLFMCFFFIHMVYSFTCCVNVILAMSENCANGPADIDSLGELIFSTDSLV